MYDINAASSAKSISLNRTCRTLVFARRRARLNSLRSVLVCKHTPSDGGPNAKENCRENNTPNKVAQGRNSHHCELRQPSMMIHWCCTVPRMSSCNDVIMLRSFGGHPIYSTSVKNPFLLNKSMVFIYKRRRTVVSSVPYISLANVAAIIIYRWWIELF